MSGKFDFSKLKEINEINQNTVLKAKVLKHLKEYNLEYTLSRNVVSAVDDMYSKHYLDSINGVGSPVGMVHANLFNSIRNMLDWIEVKTDHTSREIGKAWNSIYLKGKNEILSDKLEEEPLVNVDRNDKDKFYEGFHVGNLIVVGLLARYGGVEGLKNEIIKEAEIVASQRE